MEEPVLEDGVRVDFLKQLLELGIPEERAKKVLKVTNNASVDEASCLAFDTTDSDWEDLPDDYKMTFVVNMSLNMGVGKIASQVAHAALNLYKMLIETKNGIENAEIWQQYGEKKIILAGENAELLLLLETQALALNLPCVVIRDAGRTQVSPNSITVFALFGLEEDVNKVTGNLKLL